MDKNASIFVAGHRGLAGSAIVRALKAAGHTRILKRTRAELDLRDEAAVRAFFKKEKPAYVVLAAAKVGGIQANMDEPVAFLLENMQVQNAVIPAAFDAHVEKLLFLGSSCIYPKMAPQPIREESLLSGPLEPTNHWYATAKIAGIMLCQSYARQFGARFISAMPTNLYGPGDHFDPEKSHVMAALIRKAHLAKASNVTTMPVWGSGNPRREFLHVDDLADACLHLLKNYDAPEIINIGYGEDFSIRELAEIISRIVGFEGTLEFDPSRPDGTPRKLLDSSRIQALGWKPRIRMDDGIADAYRWYLEHAANEG